MTNPMYFSQNQKQTSLTDLLALFNEKDLTNNENFKKFLAYTFNRTKSNEFWQRDLQLIKSQLLMLWRFIQDRQSQKIKIDIVQADAHAGNIEPEHTLIFINQEDASFIIDSLQILFNQLHIDIQPIFSVGGLSVVRAHSGELQQVIDDETSTENTIIEDPILIRIPYTLPQEKLQHLHEQLLVILQEVQQAQKDQPLLREKCQSIIDELNEYKRHLPSEETREAITFLKWLLEDHFYFLGYREYSLNEESTEPSLDLISGTGLGLLRDESHAVKQRLISSMPQEAQRLAGANFPLVITKTNTKSRIHRSTYTDYISIKRYNKEGKILGEHRFIGLFPYTTENESIKHIPYLRQKAVAVMAMRKASPSSHLGKAILHILETIPRDDLFQMHVNELYDVTNAILSIRERKVSKLLIRKDAYGRFYSCLLYLPKEKITTESCQLFGKILQENLHGNETLLNLQLNDSILGRLHYIIRIPVDKRDELIDFAALEEKIYAASKSWPESLKEALVAKPVPQAAQLYQKYQGAFSLAYQEDFTPEEAIADIQVLENISDGSPLEIRLEYNKDKTQLRFKLLQANTPITLSTIIPLLENMGIETLNETAYKCKFDSKVFWICSYHIRIQENPTPELDIIQPLFKDLFFAVWDKRAENDPLNALVLKCATPWHLVSVLRAYCRYYRLISLHSQQFIESTLTKHANLSKQLLQFFTARFDIHHKNDADSITLKAEIKRSLDDVKNLEEDRVLRGFLALIDASLRTNYYQNTIDGLPKAYFAVKFHSSKIPNLPLPHPLYEIFVYSPQFEAIHLRAAKVARGGIRWSDRVEDFRTEVLGLMKAQQVKNAVIVPSGSKGGFVLKAIANKTDRAEIQQEAIFCYQNFMRGLLDLTDNLVDGKIVHPENTKIYDEDDPYLVVAADKGTATFSDYANAVAAEYNFWLGDAFASGGSQGYDHKKIGITARGAWVSVETHLKALRINPEVDEFSVVGIGDMSGDVFGNGMLLSRKIKLIAAFNHQHIFVDPNPIDTEKCYQERKRLFELPRSSWSDYNLFLVSEGGGVFDRTAKSIPLTPQIKERFNITEDNVEPAALIRAILTANVDLLFNGGIGTYVKASTERNQDVGDKSNDSVRVNGSELRCKCVGEGGNLGFTQLARVEYAQYGGLIFTDFIDNSAGVDLSDHEVNIKSLMNLALQTEQLTLNERNRLLSIMTDDVAALVLKDNVDQTETLSFAISQAENEIEIYTRSIRHFEQKNVFNRAVEYLPTERMLTERLQAGVGLTAPEIAVIMAYVKIDMKQHLLKSSLPDHPYFQPLISNEFPAALNTEFNEFLPKHPLHREIIITQLANQMMNEAGIVFIKRLQEETNARIPQIVCCYAIIREIFGLPELYDAIRALDFKVAQSTQHEMRKHLVRFLRRGTRWLIRHHVTENDLQQTIERLQPIKAMLHQMPKALIGLAADKYQGLIKHYTEAHVPQEIATALANVYGGYLLLEINAIAEKTAKAPEYVAKVYFNLGKMLGADWLRDEITNQGVVNRWEALAHSTLRDMLDQIQTQITQHALTCLTENTDDVAGNLRHWLSQCNSALEAWETTLQQLQHANKTDYVMYSVALNVLGNLVNHMGNRR